MSNLQWNVLLGHMPVWKSEDEMKQELDNIISERNPSITEDERSRLQQSMLQWHKRNQKIAAMV